jgi:hypothetical protein
VGGLTNHSTSPLALSAGHILSVRVLAGRDYGFVNFDKVINTGFSFAAVSFSLFAVFAFFVLLFVFSQAFASFSAFSRSAGGRYARVR